MNAKPFIKIPGGKRQLLPKLLERVPKKFDRYFEPFVGGGAMFFALHAAGRLTGEVVLGDLNSEFTVAYRAVRDDVDRLIDLLAPLVYDRGWFDAWRSMPVDELSETMIVARLIYLNKTSFNGLYRVNRKGQFNAPFGDHANPKICDEDNLRACSAALANVRVVTGDFDEATLLRLEPKEGDFVYFDPPYMPLSKTSNFVAYTSQGFSAADQIRLRDVVVRLTGQGVRVMVSCPDSPAIHDLYGCQGLNIEKVQARRSINCKGGSRGPVSELIIRNYGG